jgi:hypothetical protein
VAEVIKKAEIPFSEIPAKTPDEEYFVRYRIISEDQNNTSAWTPLIALTLDRGADILDGGEEISEAT